MTDKDIGKGNLLISYLFNEDGKGVNTQLTNCVCEERMKKDLQDLAEQWKEKGFIRRYIIADDECISDKLSNLN